MNPSSSHPYQCITYSGTFDHLHIGHKAMITHALKLSEKVIIGLTTQTMTTQKKLSHLIQPYNVRKSELELCLQKQNLQDRVEIRPIDDKYGFALTEPRLQAILISTEVGPRTNAESINQERVKQGLPILPIIQKELLYINSSQRISSYSIRKGIMDRNGNILPSNPLRQEIIPLISRNFELPVSLRSNLKSPIGILFEKPPAEAVKRFLNWKNDQHINKIIAVGDVVTNTLISANTIPNVSIIDYRTKRREIPSTYYPTVHTFHVSNPPAIITSPAQYAIYFACDLDGSVKIVVNGEEDLLTLPSILLAPLESCIIYGQPDEGLVVVLPTDQIKARIIDLLKQFREIESPLNNSNAEIDK